MKLTLKEIKNIDKTILANFRRKISTTIINVQFSPINQSGIISYLKNTFKRIPDYVRDNLRMILRKNKKK